MDQPDRVRRFRERLADYYGGELPSGVAVDWDGMVVMPIADCEKLLAISEHLRDLRQRAIADRRKRTVRVDYERRGR